MVKRQTQQRSAAKVKKSAPQASAVPAISGAFTYRFSGYTMKQDKPWWLTGVGQFQIDGSGILTGAHRSAIMPIAGQGAKLDTGAYSLKGNISVDATGSGDATILFTKTGGGGLDVKGRFFVTIGGDPDHLWLISAGAVVPGKDGHPDVPANESVTLEAVRVPE